MNTRNKSIFYILVLGVIIGIATGIISAFTFEVEQFVRHSEYVQAYLNNFNITSLHKKEIFAESTFKYAKTVIALWIFAFIPIGGFATFALIIFRCAMYGFTAAFLFRSYEFSGILCSLLLFLPQSLIILPIYFHTASKSINYILFNLQKSQMKKTNRSIFLEYLGTLALGLVCSAIAGFLDAYIVPAYIENFLSSFEHI